VFFGAAGRRQLSLVDELLRQFTQRLTDTQTSTHFITGAAAATRNNRAEVEGNCSAVGRKAPLTTWLGR